MQLNCFAVHLKHNIENDYTSVKKNFCKELDIYKLAVKVSI